VTNVLTCNIKILCGFSADISCQRCVLKTKTLQNVILFCNKSHGYSRRDCHATASSLAGFVIHIRHSWKLQLSPTVCQTLFQLPNNKTKHYHSKTLRCTTLHTANLYPMHLLIMVLL